MALPEKNSEQDPRLSHPADQGWRVNSPKSNLNSPWLLLRDMARDLGASWDLAFRLAKRDISVQYRGSLIGLAWTVLSPLVVAAVFIFLQSNQVLNVGETDVPYPVYAMFGTILWQFFASCLQAPLQSVNANRSILARVSFPREALILGAMGRLLFELCIKLVVLAVVMIFYGISLSWASLLAPLALLALMLLGITIGLLLTPVGFLYKDVQQVLPHVVMLWFIFTPVVYPPPQTWPYSLITVLNLVSPLLQGARDLVVKGSLAEPFAFTLIIGLSLAFLLAGWVAYRLAMPVLIERIGS